MCAATRLIRSTMPSKYPPGKIGTFQPAPDGPHQTKRLRNHRFCASYRPSFTCARVPKKTNSTANPRQTTVRRSEVKNLMTRWSMSGFGFGKGDKGLSFRSDGVRVAEKFVKPITSLSGHDRANHASAFVCHID